VKSVTRSGKRRQGRPVAVTTGLVLALTLAACGGGRGNEEAAAESGSLAEVPGFDGETFTVPMLTVTSGPVAAAAAPNLAGMQAYIEQLNAAGGIAGKYPIDLVVRDTEYNAGKAAQAYDSVKDDAVLLGNVFGTPIVQSLKDRIEADQLLALPTSFAADYVHHPALMMTDAPYETHLLAGVDYAIGQAGGDPTVCGVGGEGALQETVTQALDYGSKEAGYTVATVVGIPPTATDFTPYVQQLQSADCDVVGIVAVGEPTVAGLLAKASQLAYAPQWVGTSAQFVASMQDSPAFDYIAENYIGIGATTTYGDVENGGEAMEKLVAAHDEFSPDVPPAYQFVGGYAAMMAVDKLLTAAVENGDVSRAGLRETLASFEELDFEGLAYPWTWGEPGDRVPPSKYLVLKPTKGAPGGQTDVERDLDVPDYVVDYPFPEA